MNRFESMARTFRLLRAGGDPKGLQSPSSRGGHQVVTFAQAQNPPADSSAWSVIIGNNGSGKSRLLGNIAGELVRLHRGTSGRGGRAPKLDQLDYQTDGRQFGTDVFFQDIFGYSETREHESSLPSRVIAVALTSVDKFPLEPSGAGDEAIDRDLADIKEDNAFYCYVGMRDRTNRASISALIYRALEGLDRVRSAADAVRLRKVFELLEYSPEIHVRLTLSLSPDVQEFVRGARELHPIVNDESRLLSRLRSATKSGRYTEEWLRTVLMPFLLVPQRSIVEYTLTFGDERRPHPFNTEALRLLRRLGALTLSAVLVERLDGLTHDLREASSGQISMLTVFLSVAAHLRDGSLVLIDEPETSLHPDWQSKYINLMQEVFADFKGCHFVFSTHSPLIVADMPEGSTIYSMDRRANVSSAELVGRSPDYVMARAFDVVEPTNLYLRDVLAEALRLVGDRMIGTQAFAIQLDELVRLSATMEDGAQIKRIVQELQVAQAELAPNAD